MPFKQWLKILQTGLRHKKKKYHYILGEPLSFELADLTTQETLKRNRDSLAVSSSHNFKYDKLYQKWILLSPREQDVTALTCLKFTNHQIATYLGISIETVKTYFDRIYNKLDLQSKADIRVSFANWDFSAWERINTHR